MQASQSISISFPQAIFQVAWQIFHESFKQNPTEKANGSISMRACGSCRRARRWIDTGSACEDDRDPGNHHICWLLLLGSRFHAEVAGVRAIDEGRRARGKCVRRRRQCDRGFWICSYGEDPCRSTAALASSFSR